MIPHILCSSVVWTLKPVSEDLEYVVWYLVCGGPDLRPDSSSPAAGGGERPVPHVVGDGARVDALASHGSIGLSITNEVLSPASWSFVYDQR